jgi:beta-lactamase class A
MKRAGIGSALMLMVALHAQAFASNDSLRARIERVIAGARATVGVAVRSLDTGDTLSIRNDHRYPMQSVYKLHLAVAVLRMVDSGRISLEQRILVRLRDLHPNTWSPLRDRHPAGNVRLPLGDLLAAMVSESDNNACDILFRLAGGTAAVQRCMDRIGLRDVAIAATEHQMHTENWRVQYGNWTTPGAAAELLRMIVETDILSHASRDFLWRLMAESSNPSNRIKGMLPEGTVVAHKTGTSGSNAAGVSAATNDIGIIVLPDGARVALAVLVADSMETDAQNARIIARIARVVYDFYSTR